VFHNLRSNWWPPLVAVYAVATTAIFAGTALLGDADIDAGAGAWFVVAVTASASMIAGLAVRPRHLRAGSWMIAVGTIPGLMTLLPLALALFVGGIWTGNLAFRRPPAGLAADQVLGERRAHLIDVWWRWLILAAVLTAIGFGVLYAEGSLYDSGSESEPSVLGGVAWLLWMLSWVAAAIAAAVGVVLAVMNVVVRHRARPA
jgi:hypothetical protein